VVDNTTITDAAGATVIIADDDLSGVHYQRAKVVWGVDGVAVDASATNPLPVSGAITVADGANVAQGATADAAWSGSGSGSLVAVLKAIWTRLRGGQATMANSLPVTLASDQGAIGTVGVTSLPALSTGSNTIGNVGAATVTSPANSSTANLAASATFTGVWESALPYAQLIVSAAASSGTTAGAYIQVQQSHDQTNIESDDRIPMNINGTLAGVPVKAAYFRVLYVNSANLQTSFRLYTLKSSSPALVGTRRPTFAIQADRTSIAATTSQQIVLGVYSSAPTVRATLKRCYVTVVSNSAAAVLTFSLGRLISVPGTPVAPSVFSEESGITTAYSATTTATSQPTVSNGYIGLFSASVGINTPSVSPANLAPIVLYDHLDSPERTPPALYPGQGVQGFGLRIFASIATTVVLSAHMEWTEG
jgi:hypothetical protein